MQLVLEGVCVIPVSYNQCSGCVCVCDTGVIQLVLGVWCVCVECTNACVSEAPQSVPGGSLARW